MSSAAAWSPSGQAVSIPDWGPLLRTCASSSAVPGRPTERNGLTAVPDAPWSSAYSHRATARGAPRRHHSCERPLCRRFYSTTRRPTLLGALLMLKHTSKDCHALPFRPKRLSEVVVCQQASQNAFWSVFRKGSLSHFFEWLKSMLREPKKNRLFCTSKTHFLRENDTHTRLKVVLQRALPSQKSSTIY